jgi:hypothetical protein
VNQQQLAADPKGYLLTQHTYVCATPDGVVFLDLRSDKYLGLGGTQAHALSRVVQGWPENSLSSVELDADVCAVDVADLLVAAGLLTRDCEVGKSATPVMLTDRPLVALGEDLEPPPTIRSADVARALIALVSTTYLLRTQSMVKVVQRVTAETEKLAARAAPFDASRTAELISIFRRLRMYTFTASGNCLFHSLTLRRFLASNGILARWVVGVRTNPFRAHSWLQLHHYVMDSTPEELGFFTPILVA